MRAGRDYCPELDGLRAVAVLAVVLFHSGPSASFSGGFVGVDLFFVLSAFLITGLLVRERQVGGRIAIARFYWRRFLRLMPALGAMLAAYLIVAPFIWPGHNHFRDSILAAAYVSDYSYAFTRLPDMLRHTWSLAVEEHFYLLWPLLIAPLLKSGKPMLWLAIAFVTVTVWRASFTDLFQYYYRFDTHASGLMLGALLFFALPQLKLRPLHAYAGLALLGAIFFIAEFGEAKRWITLAEFASALLIGCAASGQLGHLGSILHNPVAVALGRWSYGIYLWHFPIALALRDRHGFLFTSTITLTASIALAAISFYTIEAWVRRSRNRA